MKRFAYLVLFVFLTQLLSAQEFQDTIPFRNNLGLIIIPVKFNGVTRQMVFDTGATKSLAYGWAKEKLTPTKRTLNIRSSSNLKSKMRLYKSGLIEIGGRKIKNHLILNAPKNEIFTCHNVEGILGTDIIELLNWKIDFQKKQLIMFPAKYVPKEVKAMYELDFEYKKKRPYAYLNVKKVRIPFLLDTGAGGPPNISKSSFKISNIDTFSGINMFTGNFDVNGILTTSEVKFFKLTNTTSKEVSLSPIIVYNKSKSSKIGNRLWKNNQLFISLNKKRLWISNAKIDKKYYGYPCSVVFQKNKMRVLSISKRSQLWKDGIRQGDVVVKFNDKVFDNFCELDKYQRNVMSKNTPLKIEFSNGKVYTLKKSDTIQ